MDSAPETPVSKRLCTESNEASTIECQSTLGNDSMVTTSHSCALDLGVMVKEARGSFEKLKHFSSNIPESKRFQYLTTHFRPSESEWLQCHSVTKQGKPGQVFSASLFD